MNLTITPLDRLAKTVESFYMNHTHLFEFLLQKLGAEELDPKKTRVRCTCPLHGGRNKEGFALYWDKGFPAWKCFSGSCGKGNIFTLVMKRYPGSSYQQAVVALGRLAGLQTDGLTIEVSKKTLEEEDLYAWKKRMGLATEQETINVFPETMLQESVNNLFHPAFKAHLIWLTETRKLPVEAIQKWQLGFVQGKTWIWQDQENPWQDSQKTKPKMVGWFEDRISFPWRDHHGILMGFGGRRVDGGELRKYKMLPGTMRALALWGLHDPLCREAIRATRTVHLMEGYTDVIRAHLHQCPHSVTLGGTALTDAQLKLLLGDLGVERVVTYLDGDGAGKDAVEAVGNQLCKFVRVDVATPPSGKDPDELYGYEEFWTPLQNARPFTSRSFR